MNASGRRGSALAVAGLVLAASPLWAPLAATLLEAARGGLPRALAAALSAPSTGRALGFSLGQAGASALLALLIGLPGAWLMANFRFPGRGALRAAALVPFCMPPVLVVLAFVLYWGRNGWLNRGAMAILGLSEPPFAFLYSTTGVVLVHAFYNFPIVLATVGATLSRLPRAGFDAARLLGAGRVRAFAVAYLPALAPSIAESAALVFLYSFFSFVILLVFGPLGGTTLEVEVYRLARLEAELPAAAALALVETGIALLVVLAIGAAGMRGRAALSGAGAPAATRRPRGLELLLLIAYLAFLLLFFVGPLLSLLVEAFTLRSSLSGPGRFGFGNFQRLAGAGGGPGSPRVGAWGGPLGAALADSLSTALPAALLSLGTASLAALALRDRKRAAAGRKESGKGLSDRLLEALMTLPLAVSGVVAALGWSLLLPGAGRAAVILVEAAAAFPFAFRSLGAALATLDPEPSRAARTLGAGKLRAALDIELRALAPSLLAAFAFAFAIAAGDATTPLVVGAPGFSPLPLLVYRLVGAYRFPEACAAGLLLSLLSGSAFLLQGRRRGHA